MMFRELCVMTVDAADAIANTIEADRRRKKKLDRIARDAEAAQRRAKGGHWK